MNALSKCSLMVLSASAMIVVPLVFAAKPPPPPPTSVNETSIVHDDDGAASPTRYTLYSDDLYSSAPTCSPLVPRAGCYNDPSNFSTGMSLTFGQWGLNLYSQTFRRIGLTFHPLPGSPASPAHDGLYATYVEIYSVCYDANNQELPTSDVTMTAGTARLRCSFGLDFGEGRTKYKLVMHPKIAGTGWSMKSCNTVNSTGKCNSWTIVPNPLAGNGNVPTVANLYLFDNRGSINLGGSANFDFIGSYYLTYRIDATNP